MVNRAAVILIGGIVLVGVVVVGGAMAFVLGGSGGDADTGTPTFQESTPLERTPSPTPSPSSPTPTRSTPTPAPTEGGGPTATATQRPRTAILPGQFNRSRIEVLVATYVNDRREAAGLDRLRRTGSLARSVRAMARGHSVAMANAGEVTHVVDGNTSTDRYERNELYGNCGWKSGLRDSIVKPDNNGPQSTENALETVGWTTAGREDGDGQFNGDDEAVARAIVENWWTDDAFNTRLTLPNAGSIGVGVEITQSGEVYATANLCS